MIEVPITQDAATPAFIIPSVYDEAFPFSEGFASVKRLDSNGSLTSGFIDTTGNEVIPFIYDYANPFFEGLAFVAKKDNENNEKWGGINKNGEVVIPFIYDGALAFSEGLAAVAQKDNDGNMKWGFIDTEGKIIIPFVYDGAALFSEELAAVAQQNRDGHTKWGYINRAEEIVIPFIYAEAYCFSEGFAAVNKGGGGAFENINEGWGFIDKNGNEVIPFNHSFAGSFSDGLAPVSADDGKGALFTGFINKNGVEVISPNYNLGMDFNDGLAAVGIFNDGSFNWGFIDKTGKEVIPCIFDNACQQNGFIMGLSNGLIPVCKNEKWGYIANPLVSANEKTVPLSGGVFANPSGMGYDRLENSAGETLVQFDNTLIDCNKQFAAGLLALNQGNPEKAVVSWQKAVELQPGNPYILQKLEEASKTEGNMAAYEEYSAQYAQVSTPQERLTQAEIAYQNGDMETAYTMYLELLQELPGETSVYLSLTDIAIAQEQYETAQGILEIGYAATESEAIKEKLLAANLKADFGTENGQTVSDGLKIAERFAELTGNSEKLELGKEIYDIVRNLK